jgi:lysophospholipase L1-like esterase
VKEGGRVGSGRRWIYWLVALWLLGYGVVLARPLLFPVARPEAHFLVLGDSYTAGVRIAPEDRWHEQLAESLRSSGIAVSAPETIAVSGWRVSDVISALAAAPLLEHYDMVAILIGSNNHFVRQPVEAFGAEFSSLLAQAIQICGGDPERVIVLGMPDWTVTPYGEQFELAAEVVESVEAYNAAMRRLTASRGAVWVDLLALSREVGPDSRLLIDDGLHPNRKMGALWAEEVLEPALQILSAD